MKNEQALNRTFIHSLAHFALLLAALALAFYASACSRKAESGAEPIAEAAGKTTGKAEAAPTAVPPVEVTTATAIMRNLQRGVDVVGSFTADEEVVVAAQAPGELAQLNVDFGSYVQAGQVIATIDQRDAKLKIEQAEATLKQTLARLGMKDGATFDATQNADVKVAKAQLDWTKMDLERAAKLVENGDVSRSIYDQAQTQNNLAQARHQAAIDAVNQQLAVVEQQRSALNLAKKALADTVVRAPISGAVKEKHTARGAYLPVNGRIVTLVKINPLRLRADIPEASAASVRTGQQMTVTVESFPNRTFTGRIVRIGPSLNEQTRALTVEAQVANPGNLLRPGMFAKSSLITVPNAPAILVPSKAVATVAGLTKVFVIANGKAEEKIVKLGVTDGDLIEIKEGVSNGATLATSNLDRLQTGSAVSTK
ncbi:MAG: efflux RND transporter periplasmic adaptor subunit [Acidobacteria bacterium]|nr:efflux RND transporter periplasmic adaptor subunit [Acidobacteriota bacterium]MBI3427257.1 efflux RND transporter periplasmic adaptor subunit [Acidobacteriota bacterium]